MWETIDTSLAMEISCGVRLRSDCCLDLSSHSFKTGEVFSKIMALRITSKSSLSGPRNDNKCVQRTLAIALTTRANFSSLFRTLEEEKALKSNIRHLGICAMLLVFQCGCIRAPRATVQLSEIMGEQVSQMQVSHEGFVKLYYEGLRQDIDQFLKDTWIPLFLGKAVENQDFRKDLDFAYALSKVNPDSVQIGLRQGASLPSDVEAALFEGIQRAVSQGGAKLGQVLIDFGQAALLEVQLQRITMMQPVDEQERMVLEEIRDGYADLQRAQASIKGYLESAVQVEEERDVILERLGLLKTQKKVLNVALRAGDAASTVLEKAESGEEAVKEFLKKLEEGRAAIEAVKNEKKGTTVTPSEGSN